MFTTRSVVLQGVPVSLIDPPRSSRTGLLRFLPPPPSKTRSSTRIFFCSRCNVFLFPRIEPKRSFVCLLVDVGCRNRKRGEKPKFVKFLFFHSSVYRASRGCPDEIFKLPNYFHTGSLFPLIVRFMRKIKFFPGRETRQEFVSALQSSPNLRD